MPTPPVKCGMDDVCDSSQAPVCCYELDPQDPQQPGALSCVPDLEDCPGSAFACDDNGDCPTEEVCCARMEQGVWRATCLAPTDCSNSTTYDESAVEMCTGGMACADGYVCSPTPPEFADIPMFYEVCQPVPYGPCVSPDGPLPPYCLPAGEVCLEFDTNMYRVCTRKECDPNAPDPCPDAPVADGAQPTCVNTFNSNYYCLLDCTNMGNPACPPGMVCVGTTFESGPIQICVWPVDPDGMGP